MSKQYNCLPSVIMNIEDDYTAFCFNEACANLIARIMKDEKPVYREDEEEVKQYKSFKDFYKDLGG